MDLSEARSALAPAHRLHEVRRVRAGLHAPATDCVAEEVPIAMVFNGVSHAVMMATPADLEDFACGFALSEGIVDTLSDVRDVEWEAGAQGHSLHLSIAPACFARLKQHRRSLAGRTGCGLCGTESLAHALRPPGALHSPACFEIRAVLDAVAGLRERQGLAARTGTTHAAAWCTAQGRIALLREDIGRHNALDKLVGALARQRVAAASGFAAVTSRASYEMVQKTASAGIPLLAAVSGVTGLAVQMAQAAGLTLLGFVRDGDAALYSHPQRLRTDPP